MGVWIEIVCSVESNHIRNVTPFVGVWIEILVDQSYLYTAVVTPFVGVWIEIPKYYIDQMEKDGHSLRGSVD